MDEFVIDFTYDQVPYTGLVRPRKEGDNLVYTVEVESQNQELNLDIIANPCGDGKMEWCFTGTPMRQEIMIRPCCRKSEKR